MCEAAERQAHARRRSGAVARSEHAGTLADVARLAREIMTATDLPAAGIAALLDCSRATVYRALKAFPAAAATRSEAAEAVSVSSRTLLGGVASPVSPPAAEAPEPAPQPIPAWIEADVNPDLGCHFDRLVAEYPLPPGQRYLDHAGRLQGLFWHDLARVGRVDRTMRLRVRRDALEFAMYMLKGELEDGISFGRVPTRETVYRPLKPRPRQPLRMLGHCPSPSTRLQ